MRSSMRAPGELRERLITALRSSVTFEAYERGGVTLLVDTGVKQVLEAAEDLLTHVEVRNHQPSTQRGRRGAALRGPDENVDVLLYELIFRAGARRLKFGDGGGEVRFLPLVEFRLEIEDLPVVLLQAQICRGFRLIAGAHFQQDLRVPVALGNPFRLGGLSGGYDQGRNDDKGYQSFHLFKAPRIFAPD